MSRLTKERCDEIRRNLEARFSVAVSIPHPLDLLDTIDALRTENAALRGHLRWALENDYRVYHPVYGGHLAAASAAWIGQRISGACRMAALMPVVHLRHLNAKLGKVLSRPT